MLPVLMLAACSIFKYIKRDEQQRQFLLSEDLDQLERDVAKIGNVGLICVDPSRPIWVASSTVIKLPRFTHSWDR